MSTECLDRVEAQASETLHISPDGSHMQMGMKPSKPGRDTQCLPVSLADSTDILHGSWVTPATLKFNEEGICKPCRDSAATCRASNTSHATGPGVYRALTQSPHLPVTAPCSLLR